MRSVERTVEELLLPAVEALGAHDGPAPPEYTFGWRQATGWLRGRGESPRPRHAREGVLVLDATASYDLDALHVQALELVLRRAGLRILTLDVESSPRA